VTSRSGSHRSTSLSSSVSPTSGSDDERLYRDPALDQSTPSEDPLVRFLVKNWRILVAAVAVYGLVWYGQVVYRQSQSRRAERASEGLARVRESYEQLVSAQESLIAAQRGGAKDDATKADDAKAVTEVKDAQLRRDEARSSLDERLKILADQGGAFTRMASVYETLSRAAIGEIVADPELAAAKAWNGVSPDNAERALAEAQAYLSAKVLLIKPETHQAGVSGLTSLAKEGAYLNAAAAISLAAVAVSTEEKEYAREILKSVRAAHPEQSDLISEETKRIGFEID
jgi:hypothetical protein